MDKVDRDGGIKTQKLYRCCLNYSLSKLTVDNELGDLSKKENLKSLEFSLYNRSSSSRSRIERVFTAY